MRAIVTGGVNRWRSAADAWMTVMRTLSLGRLPALAIGIATASPVRRCIYRFLSG